MPVIPTTGSQLYDQAIYNAQVPKEGPKACPIQLVFTAADVEFEIDLLLTQSQQFMSQVQAIFADNSQNPNDLVIVAQGINVPLRIPPLSQAYLPFLCPKNAKITASSTGETTLSIVLVNVPLPACVWGGAAQPFNP